MFIWTTLRHAPRVWQKNKGVLPKAAKSQLKVDTPDRSNYINYKNNDGKNASCWATMGRKL